MNRRSALQAGGLALAAVVLRPSPARAAADEGTLLLGLWRREMGAALAYGKVLDADPVLATLRSHETDHAAALATELSAVGLGTPRPPETPADLDFAAELLARAGPRREAVLAAAIAVEEDLGAAYRGSLPALPTAKIAMTAATILASHAQHLFILREAAGVP